MRCYLRIGNDTTEQAACHLTKASAIAEFAEAARELARYDQRIEASLHYAPSRVEIDDYPDFVLSLGPRGGIRCERC